MPSRVRALRDAADEILRTGDEAEICALVTIARRVVIVGQMALTLDQSAATKMLVRYCPEESS